MNMYKKKISELEEELETESTMCTKKLKRKDNELTNIIKYHSIVNNNNKVIAQKMKRIATNRYLHSKWILLYILTILNLNLQV